MCHSVLSDSLQPCGLKLTRLLCPWNSLSKNTGVGSHSFLQGIFLTQRSNPGLPHCRWILHQLSHETSLVAEKMHMVGNLHMSCVCAKCLQSCLTLCDPMDCCLSDSSVYGILQARILECVAMPSSRESLKPRDQTHIF